MSMEKIELFYVTGKDYHVWERIMDLFQEARFDDLEYIIEMEPVTIKSVQTSRQCLNNTKEVLESLNNDLVKYISEENLYLIYYSNQS